MAGSAILAIKIIGDATGAVKAMDKAQKASMSFKDRLGQASTGAKFALGAIAGGAVVVANSAADLQQSVGGVETVFGKSSTKMLEWSKNAAQSAGLSQNAYNEFATTLGSQLQNMGMDVDQSAVKTNDLIGLGADLSSMFGGTTSDAVGALSSALKGEMDPIEKYGISLNDATLKAKAQALGLGDLYAAGDSNAKMQATMAAITDQSGKAVGNYAKEADTAQGQQSRMTAGFENAKASLGASLLPALTMGAQVLSQFATWVQENSSWLTPLAIAIGVVSAAVWILNIAMNANPIVLLITIIAGLIAILIGWASQSDNVKNAWGSVTGWFQNIGKSISDAFKRAGNWIKDTWNGLIDWFRSVPGKIGGFFRGMGETISAPFKNAFNGIKSIWNSTVGRIGFTVPDWIPGIGGKSFHVPKLATGGVLSTAGTVMVGERGPELLTLPAGAQVTPLSRATYHFGDQGQPVNYTYNITIQGKLLDEEGTVKQLLTMIKKYDRKRGN